eukprot:scaffold5423_cov133-Isochrysis_galbana.AAC.4
MARAPMRPFAIAGGWGGVRWVGGLGGGAGDVHTEACADRHALSVVCSGSYHRHHVWHGFKIL